MLNIDNSNIFLRKTLRILIVDDEESLVELMTIFLTKVFNYLESNIYKAGNGEEALKLVDTLYHEKKLPNIILTDIRMEKMDGLTFCNKIKELYINQWKEIAVVAITGISLKEEQKVLEEKLNALDIPLIYKPFEYRSLILDAEKIFIKKINNKPSITKQQHEN